VKRRQIAEPRRANSLRYHFECRLLRLENRLRHSALRDVLDHRHCPQWLTFGVPEHGRCHLGPDNGAIFSNVPLVNCVFCGSASREMQPASSVVLQVFGMCNFEERHVQEFIGRVAHHVAKSGIDPQESPRFRIHLRLADSGQFEVSSEFLFARTERLFRAFALVDFRI
jgi:hypothetical protein